MTITTTRRPTTTGRRTIGALRLLVAAAARYTAIAPAPAVKQQPVPAAITTAPAVERPADDPADVFTADEMPALSDITAAAEKYLQAAEQARTADRARRAARKILDRLPAGRYGAWTVERIDNAREIADLDAIRAVFAAHGLGDVPMRRVAPSLKVGFSPELIEAASA
jgi:hypothetical protein